MASRYGRVIIWLILFCSLPSKAVSLLRRISGYDDTSRDGNQLVWRQEAENDIPLRILPLGDSITAGHMSSDGNGYRLDLYNDLVKSGRTVDFIGSLREGSNNPNNQMEGFGGYNITHITKTVMSDGILFQHPNVVLLHAGTNDMLIWGTPGEPYAEAPDRLGNLIGIVLCECPDAVVLVAQIVGNVFAQPLVDVFNAAIPGVVDRWTRQGYKVTVVDQSDVNGTNLADGVHPDDFGYAMMAVNWFEAIQSLPVGWITTPRAEVNGTALDGCSPAPEMVASSTSSNLGPSTVMTASSHTITATATTSSAASGTRLPAASGPTVASPSATAALPNGKPATSGDVHSTTTPSSATATSAAGVSSRGPEQLGMAAQTLSLLCALWTWL